VSLTEARDRLAQPGSNNFESFIGNFASRDRAFAYIGTEADEQGRLVLVNLSQQGAKTLLTPANLTVLDFEPYPLGDRLLFSAIPPSNNRLEPLIRPYIRWRRAWPLSPLRTQFQLNQPPSPLRTLQARSPKS
jgi:hypothetical protein